MSWVQKEIRLNQRRRGTNTVACFEMNRAPNISRKRLSFGPQRDRRSTA